MKTGNHISFRGSWRLMAMLLCGASILGGTTAVGQGFYDDDLYFDASKAKKEKTVKEPKNKSQSAGNANSGNVLYYYDGVSYVPWDKAGNFNAAGSYQPEGTSTRDVDEYNRRYTSAQPDSISLEQFEDYSANLSATRNLARFEGSSVAAQALEDEGYDLSFNNGYNEGYAAGYDKGYNQADNGSVVVSFGTGYYPSWLYPYGYGGLYDTWGWPYNGWRYTYYNPYYYGWTPMWGWNWGWTSPSWGWGGWYPGGYYPGWNYGWIGHGHPSSPSAAHRPRTGSNYGTADRGSNTGARTGSGFNNGGSSRPGYHPPVDGRINGGSSTSGNRTGFGYGGSSSGRNSHYGGSRTGSSRSNGYSGSSSGSSRSSGYSGSSSSSGRSGGYSGGSHSSGGSRSSGGGGGHRSR